MDEYEDFIRNRTQSPGGHGFEPLWLPDMFFPVQSSLTSWAIRSGRAAILAGTGMGKTGMQLVWSENVVRHTNRPVLLLAPLSVVAQTVRESSKFGVDCYRSNDGKFPSGARVVITNYDRLHLFDPNDFSGAAADESGCIKHMNSQRTGEIIEFFRTLKYRLLCTATPAPNDYIELGTSAEALGEMGFQDMIGRFFKKQQAGGHRGWAREKFSLKGHASDGFWRWVCSWARAVRKPSDLGFDDGPFILPPMVTNEHVVTSRTKREGFLFDMPAITLEEQREERRRTTTERCEKVAELLTHDRPAIAWCHLNTEGDLLTKLIPGAAQVSGADSEEFKEEKFLAFVDGQIRTLVTKPEVAGYGLNFQHCSHQAMFPSHSYERAFQCIRRCWRFGQKNECVVDIVTSEGERGVLENLKRKSDAADRMFEKMVALMHDHLVIDRRNPFTKVSEAPSWLGVDTSVSVPSSSPKRKRKNVPDAIIG